MCIPTFKCVYHPNFFFIYSPTRSVPQSFVPLRLFPRQATLLHSICLEGVRSLGDRVHVTIPCILWGMAKISLFFSWFACITCVSQGSRVCILCVSQKQKVCIPYRCGYTLSPGLVGAMVPLENSPPIQSQPQHQVGLCFLGILGISRADKATVAFDSPHKSFGYDEFFFFISRACQSLHTLVPPPPPCTCTHTSDTRHSTYSEAFAVFPGILCLWYTTILTGFALFPSSFSQTFLGRPNASTEP